MKKVILFGVILLLSLSYAQAQQITAGGGLAYGTDISKAGITINGQYFFTEKFAVAPSFIFYFPEKNSYSNSGYSTEVKSSVWEFNADVNYYFYKSNIVRFFGEGGLNITTAKSKIKTTGNFNQNQTASDSKAGINLGVGADFKAGDKIIPFVSMKYTVSSFDQLVIRGGIRFLLN
jgi:hypothetical protein